jgi:hypothetical protein
MHVGGEIRAGVLVEKLKETTCRPRCRWEGSIKMPLAIYLAQERDKWRAVVKTVMNCRIP